MNKSAVGNHVCNKYSTDLGKYVKNISEFIISIQYNTELRQQKVNENKWIAINMLV